MAKKRRGQVEHGDNQARARRLKDKAEKAPRAGDNQQLSTVQQSSGQYVEELADEGQAIEAGMLEGVERAADEPEEEGETEHPHPEDIPRKREE
jgi:hypothetical protein